MYKKIVSLILIIIIAVSVLSLEPIASAETMADALVNTALKYKGSTGYVCDTFVGAMAKKAGIPENIIPYSFGGVETGYKKLINNCGAIPVTSPKAGDILFYYCTESGHYCHVGIMIDATNSIQGGLYSPNYNTIDTMPYKDYRDWHPNGVSHKVGKGVNAVFVRPNYGSTPPTQKYVFDVNTTLDGVAYNSGQDSVTFDVYINGKQVANDKHDYYNDSVASGSTYEVTDIKVNGDYRNNGKSSYTGKVTGETVVKIPIVTLYTLDVNLTVDGTWAAYGHDSTTFDLTVNGTKVANDKKDFSQKYSKGSTYKIDDIRVSGCWKNNGASSISGTLNDSVSAVIPIVTNHNWNSGTVTQAATCSSTGVRKYTCTSCGSTKTEKIEKTDHEKLSWKDVGGDVYHYDCDKCGVTDRIITLRNKAALDGHVYYFFDGKLTWWEAKSFAYWHLGDAGYLMRVNSAKEQKILDDDYSENGEFGLWLGGSDKEQEGVWKWTDGEKFSYTNWNSGEPNNANGGEHYLCTGVNGKWNDTYNRRTAGFVLEYECKHTSGTEVRNAKDATCTEDGYTGDMYCSECDAKIAGGNEIPALGHTEADGKGKCGRCGQLLNLRSDQCGHILPFENYSGDDECVRIIAVSTNDDEIELEIDVCHLQDLNYCRFELEYDPTVLELVHWGERNAFFDIGQEWGKTIVEYPFDNGNNEYIDTASATTLYMKVLQDKTTHLKINGFSWATRQNGITPAGGQFELDLSDPIWRTAWQPSGEAIQEHLFHVKELIQEETCTNDEQALMQCPYCGVQYFNIVEANGHSWDSGTITKAPTATEEGIKTYTCTVCGETKPEAIPPVSAGTGYTPGDINGDGKVNNKDLTRLMKYLAGEEVTVAEAALDVNGDGKVNNKDLTRLMKYLAGEEVEIH